MIRRNQYIRYEGSIEDIAKIEIEQEGYEYTEIADMEIPEEEPNIMIYIVNKDVRREEIEMEYMNIYSKIRVIITGGFSVRGRNEFFESIFDDGYKKLPKHIEYLIVDKRIYKIEDEFEMMRFMRHRTLKRYIKEEIIKKGRYDEENRNGETALMVCIGRKRMESIIIELIQKMSEEKINKKTKNKDIILKRAIFNSIKSWKIVKEIMKKTREEVLNMIDDTEETLLQCLLLCGAEEEIIMEVIGKLSEENINKKEKIYERSALEYACNNRKLSKVAIEIMKRTKDEIINNVNKDGETALIYACMNKMEDVAIELIDRMTRETIKERDRDGRTALHYACINSMRKVAMKLLMKMEKEEIEMLDDMELGAMEYSKRNNMRRVIRMIRLKTKNKK